MKELTESRIKEMQDAGCVYHHTGSRRGYLSRKTGKEYIEEYIGKFGSGFVVLSPRWDTSQYINVAYFLKSQ